MDERRAKATVIKQHRRQILGVLKAVYPASLDYDSLSETLPLLEEHHLRQDLAYLIDKGYVRVINDRAGLAWAKKQFVLTAAGVEQADAIRLDPAIEP